MAAVCCSQAKSSVRGQLPWVQESFLRAVFDQLVFNVYPSSWPITLTADPRAEAARVVDGLR